MGSEMCIRDRDGYGETPIDRIRFIIDVIRNHLAVQQCALHLGSARDDLTALLGESLRWCPACGLRLASPAAED